MNHYVAVMTDLIDYIEQRISDKLTLAELSARAHISDFHFNRIFKTVVGITLKQYILGRKLWYAAQLLSESTRPVIDIALELGFDYPEVFSRAFKNQVGLSPAVYRHQPNPQALMPKASVVERDIINYRGTLALKGDVHLFEPLLLHGVRSLVNENAHDFEQKLKCVNEAFLRATAGDSHFMQNRFFTAVKCSGNEDGSYDVFCGREPVSSDAAAPYDVLHVPGGWYADFLYGGDMFDIKEVFIDDLYKWIMVKEAKLASNVIGMLNIYPADYASSGHVHILVPVQGPV